MGQVFRIQSTENLEDGAPVANETTGMGIIEHDASTATKIVRRTFDQRDALEDAYAECDLVQKACNLLDEDAWSRGLKIPSLPNNPADAVYRRLSELDVYDKFRQAGVYARVFGDAYLVLDDGRLPSRPLRNYRPGRLVSLPLFTGYEMFPDSVLVERRFGRPNFDEPLVYWLANRKENEFVVRPEDMVPIHPSRVLRFSYLKNPPGGWKRAGTLGFVLPPEMGVSDRIGNIMRTRAYCSLSLLQAILHLVVKELTGLESSEQLLTQASVAELPVNNLENMNQAEMLEARAKARLISNTMSNWRVLLRPSGNGLQRTNIPLVGLNDLLMANVQRLCIGLDLTFSRFIGLDAPGMNGNISGEASTRRHSSKVDSYRRNKIDPNLRRLMELIAIDTGRRRRGIQWEWPSYLQKSDEEIAQERKAKLDSITAFAQFAREQAGEGGVNIDQGKAQRVIDGVLDDLIEDMGESEERT